MSIVVPVGWLVVWLFVWLVACSGSIAIGQPSPSKDPAPPQTKRDAAGKPERIDPLGSLPAEIRERRWTSEVHSTALARSLGYCFATREQLDRIAAKMPEFAARAKGARKAFDDAFGAGIDASIAELKLRNKGFDKDLAKMRADARREAQKTALRAKEIEAAFEAGRWDPTKIPTEIIAPILCLDPATLSDPASTLIVGFGAPMKVASKDGTRTLTITVPRTWAMNSRRAAPGMLSSVFSDLGFGPCALIVNAIKVAPPWMDTSATSMLGVADKVPTPDGRIKRSARVESFGGRDAAVIVVDFDPPGPEGVLRTRLVSVYWVQDGAIIESAWSIQAERGKDEAFPVKEFDAAWEHYRPLFDAMAATTRIEVVEKKIQEPAKPESAPTENRRTPDD